MIEFEGGVWTTENIKQRQDKCVSVSVCAVVVCACAGLCVFAVHMCVSECTPNVIQDHNGGRTERSRTHLIWRGGLH